MSNAVESVSLQAPSPSPRSSFDGRDVISLGFLVGTGFITFALWSSLPERIPTHFGLTGEVDDTSTRAFGAVILPVVAGLLFIVLRVIPRFFAGSWRARAAASPMSLITMLTTGLIVGIHAVCLWAALHPGASGAAPLAVILGTFWIALSLVLPRVRRNPLVGIRTAWTLASDENWAKTHRFAGLVGVPAGLVVIAAGLAGSFPAAIAAIAVSALASAAYSFIESRREQASNA